MRATRLLLLTGVLLGLLLPARGFGWQDLHPDFVRQRVEHIADPRTPADERRASSWTLVSAGRASVGALANLARTDSRLQWTSIGLLDLVRTDALVVETFSALLDGLPGGLNGSGEVRGFVRSRLEDMLGRTFPSDVERRTFVAQNARYLVFEPATLRFVIDEEARKKKQAMRHYPYAPSSHAAVDLAFWRLLLALHLGQTQAVESMLGPGVRLVRGGGKLEVRPELDLDAFSDPPHNHRALTVRDEGSGRWLVRTGSAYFFFEGGRCVQAGMKPIE
jgi:hypothetical protein